MQLDVRDFGTNFVKASDNLEPFLLIFGAQISLVGGFNPKKLWFTWASASESAAHGWNHEPALGDQYQPFLCRSTSLS